ncbi:MAG: hypothetical protein IPH97_02085 [Ignavibacteriales bacterium]|nr:hypothetical protein [Ignavibacteriales bacterium]
MESFIKDFFSLLKDLQGIIGVLFGWWFANSISKKERKQKEINTESERIDRYRLSAITERLAAHQKAFEIFYNLSLNIHSEDKTQNDFIKEARQFWITNCLYLTPKCREVFDNFIFEFSMYKINRQIWFDTKEEKEKKKRSAELIEKFNNIMSVGRIIQEEVDISYTEPKRITELKKEEKEKLEKP